MRCFYLMLLSLFFIGGMAAEHYKEEIKDFVQQFLPSKSPVDDSIPVTITDILSVNTSGNVYVVKLKIDKMVTNAKGVMTVNDKHRLAFDGVGDGQETNVVCVNVVLDGLGININDVTKNLSKQKVSLKFQ